MGSYVSPGKVMRELTLEDLLAEPMVRLLMQRDQQEEDSLRGTLAQLVATYAERAHPANA